MISFTPAPPSTCMCNGILRKRSDKTKTLRYLDRPQRYVAHSTNGGNPRENRDNGLRKSMVEKLERSLYFSPVEGAAKASGIASTTKTIREPYINTKTGEVVLRNLPLWRVQWTVVPGVAQQLHVHVPHYTHMFKSVLSKASPRLFGHLYLPGGSKYLGDENYALKAGSKAALTGCLMEIQDYEETSDGRLILWAVSLCRIIVIKQKQQLPYAVADCAMLLDAEEVATFKQIGKLCAQSVREEVNKDEPLPGSPEEESSDQAINKCNTKERAARVAASAANAFYWSIENETIGENELPSILASNERDKSNSGVSLLPWESSDLTSFSKESIAKSAKEWAAMAATIFARKSYTGKLDQELHLLPRLVGSDVSNNENLSAWKELLENLGKELSALNTLVTKSGPKVGTHFGQYENIGQHMARTQIILESAQSIGAEKGDDEEESFKEGSVEQIAVIRSAQRVSWEALMFVPDIWEKPELLQKVLEVGGLKKRLNFTIQALRTQRNVLTAIIALVESERDSKAKDKDSDSSNDSGEENP